MSAALRPRVGREPLYFRASPWPAGDATLRQMWADGVLTRVIADTLKTTRNSVIGRARRIGLPARPSPIRPPSEAPTNAKPIGRHATLPALIVDGAVGTFPTTVGIRVSPEGHDARSHLPRVTDAPAPGAGQELFAVSPQPRQPGRLSCQFIFGEPALHTPWHFCGEPTGKHRSWCDGHRAVVFTPESLKHADRAE